MVEDVVVFVEEVVGGGVVEVLVVELVVVLIVELVVVLTVDVVVGLVPELPPSALFTAMSNRPFS